MFSQYNTPLTTAVQAKAFIRMLDSIGSLFHFDDSPESVINVVTGERLFDDLKAPLVAKRVEEMFGFSFDPFSVAVDLTNGVYDKGVREGAEATLMRPDTGEFLTVRVRMISGAKAIVTTVGLEWNYDFTTNMCLLATDFEEEVVEFSEGDVVKFRELTEEDDPATTYTVLEMRGDRMLVQANNGMRLKPTYVVMVADMVCP